MFPINALKGRVTVVRCVSIKIQNKYQCNAFIASLRDWFPLTKCREIGFFLSLRLQSHDQKMSWTKIISYDIQFPLSRATVARRFYCYWKPSFKPDGIFLDQKPSENTCLGEVAHRGGITHSVNRVVGGSRYRKYLARMRACTCTLPNV